MQDKGYGGIIYLLQDKGYRTSVCCRFVLAAVSPAVVVPSMLALQDKGYGVDKGIPTLVIAAASVDDVLAISGFGVVLGIAFSTGTFTFLLIC